jgi:hypothetical protein
VAGSSLGGGSDWQHGDPLAGDDFDFGWTGRLVVAGDEDRSRAAVTALARNSRRVQLEHHALASPTSWRSDEICCCRLPRTASQRERTPVPAWANPLNPLPVMTIPADATRYAEVGMLNSGHKLDRGGTHAHAHCCPMQSAPAQATLE